MKNYVVFTQYVGGKEIYIAKPQLLKSRTNFVAESKTFLTARAAYEWAGAHNLDDWRVGLR